MPTMTPAIQHDLYAETDARFWAQTGYKPGQKLDPKNPLDKKQIPVYVDIYNKVLTQWRNGTLTFTFNHPAVAQSLNDAAAASAAAIASMTSAAEALAGDAPHEAYGHLQDASVHQAAVQAATAQAAAAQPPTASPVHVRQAAHEVAQFVMDAGGRGVPVSNGHDMVGVMQATSAPVKVALDSGAPPATVPSAPVSDVNDSSPARHGGIVKFVAAGAAVAGVIALVAAKGSGAGKRPVYGPRRRSQEPYRGRG